MHTFHIGDVPVGESAPAFVIAEIGQNHQGSVEIAKELFAAAARAGASAVKLQKRDHRAYTEVFNRSAYTGPNSFGRTYGEHRRSLEFGEDEYVYLKKYAEDLGLVFLATPFDLVSAEMLLKIDLAAYKIASGDIVNHQLISRVAQSGKPLIISTGGADFTEVAAAYNAASAHHGRLALLQCTASYPSAGDELNVSVVKSLAESFAGVVTGFSSHSLSLVPALMAFTLGARIFEYHFTFNRGWRGSDHKISLEPPELERLVQQLRIAEQALGDGKKIPYESELRQLAKTRKSLVAACQVTAGNRLEETMLAAKVAGGGVCPSRVSELIGRKVLRDLTPDEPIVPDAVEM